MAGVSRLRSRSQGLLAGLVLIGLVSFLQRGTLQYADVPLAFFILSAVLLLVLYDASERPQRGLLVLSGLAAGLAAWTKNEGLLLLLVLPAALAPSFGDGVAREGSARSFSAGSPALADSGGRGDPKDLSQREQ